MITSFTPFRRHRRITRHLPVVLGLLLVGAGSLAAADAPKKIFNLPADDAAKVLKAFSEQSGEQIIYPVAQVRGVKTRAVQGEYSARAALEALLRDTDLVVVEDEKTGALAIRRETSAEKKDDSPLRAFALEPAVELDEYRVLGTRIRQAEGPSPVSFYDSDYIKSTGAFTLADFLNQIPQVYSGIASGRGSTPNELNPEFGQRSESTTPSYNYAVGSSAAPPGQTGVSGVSLRGLGAGSTLVLVDGRRAAQSGAGNRSTDTRQGFVDLNTIPLGMIERVEVLTDGASAIYGADAVAGVINIVLKKNYSGTEVRTNYKATEHGGGRERNVSVMHGFAFGKLSGTVAIDYYDRQNLKASDRAFSKNQNHSAIPAGTLIATGATKYGRDYRLLWGYPAVVQAVGGTVTGTFDAVPGVRVLLAPEGSVGTPAVSQFVPTFAVVAPASMVNASGQRRFNTSEYLDLVPESERTGLNANFTYKFNDRYQAYAALRTSEVKSFTNAQIGGSSITGSFGTPAVLLAAYSPFNQNVQIGMVLPEWGSATQRVRTLTDAVNAGVRGVAFQTWEWDLGVNWQNLKTRQITREFNGAGFANLLNNPDPAKRFNPFIDYRAPGAPSQAALLETLSKYPYLGSEVIAKGADFSADGDLVDLWGGAIKAAFGGSVGRSEVESTSINYSSAAVPVASTSVASAAQRSTAAYVELSVPVFGKPNARTLLRRLDLQLAGRYEEVGSFTKTVPKLGLSWAPLDSVLLRGSWSEGFRAPSTTEYLTADTTSTSTLSDPRRTPVSTTGIVVTNGSNPTASAERSENSFAGLIFDPPFVKGLSFQVNYYDTVQNDVLQLLSAQTIVNNEAVFADRIIRAAPDATDTALGQPGRITAVDRTFVNFGEVVNRSADLVVDYQLPWEQLGTWRLNFAASRTLEASRALAPGQPAVVLDDDTNSPPKWKFNSSLFWRKGRWTASAFLWYLGSFQSNAAGNTLVANDAATIYYPTPAVTKLDLRATYEFTDGVWRRYGKGLRIGLGVSNVFDQEPPFSDTVWGFNAGLHSQLILGRAYEFSTVLPF